MHIRRRWLVLLTLLVVLAADLAPAFAENGTPTATDPEEQTVLAQLFSLNRSLEQGQAEIDDLARQIATVTAQETTAAAERDRLEAQRQDRLAHFGRRLRFYQETGTTSSIAYLLASQTLNDFLDRLTNLQAVLEQDSRLMAELRLLKAQVAAQAQTLSNQQAQLTVLRANRAAQQDEIRGQIADKEQILQSLRDKRAAVEAQLQSLDAIWESTAKPVLFDLGHALQTVDADGFQPDSIKATILPPGATIRISETNLNRLLIGHSDLTGMSVKVSADRITLEGTFAGTLIMVAGNFSVIDKAILRFVPLEIDVGTFKVPDKVVAAILTEGKLDIDTAPFLGGYALQSVRLESPYLVIKAGLK